MAIHPRSKAERYRSYARELRAIALELKPEKAAYLQHIADEYEDLAAQAEALQDTTSR